MKLNKTYVRIKCILWGAFALFLLFRVVRINVTAFREGDGLPRSGDREVTYFTDFSMETFEGDVFTEEDLKRAKITVFNAWGPYCGSCLDEMPVLEALADEIWDRGVQIVGIQSDAYAYPEDVPLSRSEAAETGVSYPLLLADRAYHEQLRPLLGDALPGTWVVDAGGHVLDFVQGARTKEAWREYLEPYLEREEP